MKPYTAGATPTPPTSTSISTRPRRRNQDRIHSHQFEGSVTHPKSNLTNDAPTTPTTKPWYQPRRRWLKCPSALALTYTYVP